METVQTRLNTAYKYEISAEMSKRINLLRNIMIVLIVYIHVYNSGGMDIAAAACPEWFSAIKYFISQGICRVGVPILFMFSAILLYRKPFTWAQNMKKKTRTLLVPFLIINTLWIAIYFVAQKISFTAPYFANPENTIQNFSVMDWLNAYFCVTERAYPFVYPLWFIKDLIILNLLAVWIKRGIDTCPKVILGAATLLWVLDMWFVSPLNLFNTSLQAFVFFIYGCYIVKYGITFETLDKYLSLKWLAPAYAVFLGADLLNLWFDIPVVHNVGIIVGILFWICLSKTLVKGGGKVRLALSNVLTTYNFIIFAFHELNMSAVRKVFIKLVPQTTVVQVAEYFLIPVFIMACCVLLGFLLKKLVPPVFGLITGGRVSEKQK